MVESVVEHADDLTRLVVHDAFLLCVVQGGHGEAAIVVLLVLEVDLADVGKFRVDGVRGDVLAGGVLVVFGGETPACGNSR